MSRVDDDLESPRPIDALFFRDERGTFAKFFDQRNWPSADLSYPAEFKVSEVFISRSCRGVVRGMHFQVPPADHGKIVFCIKGLALDVMLDVRRSSPQFGRVNALELNSKVLGGVYIPKGFAHGFQALTDDTEMLYLTTSPQSKEHESGVRWDSFDFRWPISPEILSPRDRQLPTLDQIHNQKLWE